VTFPDTGEDVGGPDEHAVEQADRRADEEAQARQRFDLPRSTYRLQLTPTWGFAAAREILGYLHSLGVTHLYLSPVLQAAPGSTHGYDVVDHGRISEELGGEQALRDLAGHAHELGMGVVVDVVPNHMAVPSPASANAALWSVLRDGPSSDFARWFDVDWAAQDQAILMPVLGQRIGQCLADGEIAFDDSGAQPLLRYYDHVFPVRPGTEDLALPELLERQWYRLAHHKVGQDELNYRRFFDVDGLAAIRVEDPVVFDATHELLLQLYDDGVIHGFRIDHPDGLTDPRGYLRRLRAAAPDSWIVVEKILEGLGPDDESLPEDWPVDGTTGYDTLNRTMGVLIDRAGADALTSQWVEVADDDLRDYQRVVSDAKRDVVANVLRAELSRLAGLAHAICNDDISLRDITQRSLRDALEELLVSFPSYRAYVVPGEDPAPESVALLDHAHHDAAAARPDLVDELGVLRDLALLRVGRPGDLRRDEFCVRFQQTCGPVMAKGVEDTASYRWLRLTALNEVGGDPSALGLPADDVHSWFGRQQERSPHGMTTLSTHDTKRSEDARARLAALAEAPDLWHELVEQWESELDTDTRLPDAATRYLLWQSAVATWPITSERLGDYLVKATREAKRHTSWTNVDEDYERCVLGLVDYVMDGGWFHDSIDAAVASLDAVASVISLAQKAVQLTAPGVPDVYQGCELIDRSLVDPDNRRPVDYQRRARMLADLDSWTDQLLRGSTSWQDSVDASKLALTAQVLRLRRRRPEAFGAGATYRPMATTSAHVFAFLRGDDAATIVTRRPAALAALGGWGEQRVVLPPGQWRDVVTGTTSHGGEQPLADVLAHLPATVLERS
jgi:(1->4)-alpha-D-glucan 1-alpha-D-glucosylmutase